MAIIKEDNGTYTVRWRQRNPLTDEIKHKAKRGFRTKREARDFEITVEAEMTTHTFQSLMEEYLVSLKGYANDETIHAKRRTYEMYCDHLMKREVNEISSQTMTAWKNYVYELSLSVTQKNRIITNVRSLSHFGYVNYDYNDFAKMIKRFPKSSEDVKEMRILSPEDFERVISFEQNPIYKAFLIFLYHTGCRRGEALALNKADVQAKQANLNKSIRRPNSPQSRLKNAQSKRTILLDETVLSAIEPLMELEGEYLFGGKEPLSPTSIDRHFKNDCKKANITGIRIHDLRHSFISNAILNGMNIVTVSKYVGHKNVTTTLDQYSHLLNESQEDFISKMSKLYKG